MSTATDIRPLSAREEGEGNWFTRIFVDNVLVKFTVITICVLWMIPALGLLITSFREPALARTTGWWSALTTPFEFTQWTFSNYTQVLEGGMGQAFVNSLAVAVPATVIPITIAAFAAYAFAWMDFPGRQVGFVVIVGLLVVPLQMALIPLLRIYTSGARIGPIPLFPDLDLNGTYLAVWLAHTGFGLPLAIYLFRNYIGGLPRSIIESARIDGASHFAIFWRLIVPLSVPAIASFAIFQFLWVWNDLLVALVFLGGNPDNAVMTQTLTEMVGSRGEAQHLLTSGAFLTMVVPIAVFFGLQRYFVRGLTAGAVKG